jgi:hypothetical protein
VHDPEHLDAIADDPKNDLVSAVGDPFDRQFTVLLYVGEPLRAIGKRESRICKFDHKSYGTLRIILRYIIAYLFEIGIGVDREKDFHAAFRARFVLPQFLYLAISRSLTSSIGIIRPALADSIPA